MDSGMSFEVGQTAEIRRYIPQMIGSQATIIVQLLSRKRCRARSDFRSFAGASARCQYISATAEAKYRKRLLKLVIATDRKFKKYIYILCDPTVLINLSVGIYGYIVIFC